MSTLRPISNGGVSHYQRGVRGSRSGSVRTLDLPIPVDETWSYGVANAARGVQDRHGSEAFFEFSRVAFEHHEAYSWDVVGYAAEEAGADPCAAIADGESGTYDLVLQSDRNAGVERGVEATPTVFVDGDAVSEPTAEAISDAIDAAR